MQELTNSRKRFDDYPDLLTIRQFCEMMCLCRQSAYRVLKKGKIHHVRVGSKYIIPKKTLLDYLMTVR